MDQAAAERVEGLLAPRPRPVATAEPAPLASQTGNKFRRVLFFGKSMSRSRSSGAVVDALEQHGLEVHWVNMATLRRWLGQDGAAQRARQVFRDMEPCLVMSFFMDLPEELLREFRQRVPVTIWCEEPLLDLVAAADPLPRYVPYMAAADLVSLSNPAKLPLLEAAGVAPQRLVFTMSGYSPRYHQPRPVTRYRRDVAFLGGPGSRGQRVPLLLEIARHCNLEVFGRGWDRHPGVRGKLRVRRAVKPKGFARVAASSRIVLGTNAVNDNRLYWSNRTWLTLGVGAFHLTQYVPGMEEVFERGVHLDWFADADEAVARIASWLPDEAGRRRVADAGHALVQAHHQYFHRMGQLLARLEQQREHFHCASWGGAGAHGAADSGMNGNGVVGSTAVGNGVASGPVATGRVPGSTR